MTTLTRPTWFRPRECGLALRKSGLQFVSPFNGTMQAVDTLAERWIMNLGMPGAADGGARSAFFNQWAGGVNHVPLYHFGRPQPLGTLRGAPTLANATARGDTSLALAGARGFNALLGGSFETDSNADGLADGWARYNAGSTGTLAQYLSPLATVAGAWSQLVEASALGSGFGDNNGVVQAVPVAHLAGKSVAAACYVAITAGTRASMQVAWLNAADVQIASMPVPTTSTAGSLQYLEAVGVCPADAVRAVCYIWQHTGSGTAAAMYIDGAQLVAGPVGAFPLPATLLAGDMISDGTQLYMVASDCTATDAGAMTVPVVNRARGVVASGTVVQWDRPTALFALPAMEQSTTWLRGGHVESMVIDAVEVY